MMKSDEKYQVPAWMRPLLPLLCNTGGNVPEELLNDTETTASANVVRYVLIVAVRSLSGEPGMYILRRDTPIMIVSYQGWSGGHAACPLHSPE